MAIETPSDRDYPCFVCGQWKTKNIHATCEKCGIPINVGPMCEGVKVEGYKIQKHVARGYYGATFRGENRIGKPFAVKLVPRKLYEQNDKSFESELGRYRKLGSHSNIADLIDAGEVQLEIGGRSVSFYFIVMEWVDGLTLSQILEARAPSVNEIFGAIFDIASALSRFENENLWHNDLNSDNILFKAITDDERRTRRIDTPYICKVVDVGSSVFRQSKQPDRLSDLAFLGLHIGSLRKAVLDGGALLTKEDRFFLDGLDKLVARLLDESPARSFESAGSVLQEVQDIFERRLLLNANPEVQLSDPFAYLNANDFPNEGFINALFSQSFPWVRDIITPEAQNTLITGPRGSGKTMVLRSMRLKTRLYPTKPDETSGAIAKRIADDPLLAFYVSARI